MQPVLTHIADIRIEVGQPVTVGETGDGLRRIVPILGGTIRGEISGEICAAGADYQLIRADGFTTLDARYAARLDNGEHLFIVNTGVRFGPIDVMERITRGEPVPPEQVYFRTTPRFETTSAEHAWLTRHIFVASGIRHPDCVELRVFRVE
ncbi:hypothetical protein BTH42_12820 [Burkholderia sp. SRS-W-2-2016]|uniref:DUF3237 domain-containing protein n=1 Tax=Burkholderia sp. SRS-W-2-2016 TaxID=1926878 RepID=UPI00094B4FE7|nr:DUF3237 domain-containing protein [Burkholderia sp. SRS-W-2-2016]OLL31094.1 hypothetical protein BTH42_12820 [Burkholderia sp. SRS-W-2-2016]